MSRAAVIIFGAAVRPDGRPSAALAARVAAALAWGEAQGEPPLYMPTGGIGRHGPAESEVMARLLRESGVEATRIEQEPTATDTLSSAIACVRLLRALGHRGPVRAATHRYHLPRCLALLRIAGLPAEAVPPPPGPPSLAWRRSLYWRLREVPGLPYDAALMVWARLTGKL